MKLMGLLLGDADTAELEATLKPEPALTVNLLRMTNSVGAGCSETITSLRHAITVLGRRQLQRWLQLLVFASGSQAGSTNPLLMMAATRGRLMELLAGELRSGDAAFSDQAFMVGIMSLMPTLLSLPIEEIVAAIMGMAHALGYMVVAEGIETPTQRDFLADSRCDVGQGYLFGRPGPIEVVESQMRTSL